MNQDTPYKLQDIINLDILEMLKDYGVGWNDPYDVIREFEKLSGFPIILNTSFNVNGMPLVETPGDALDCFYMSGIDYLVLNNFIVSK